MDKVVSETYLERSIAAVMKDWQERKRTAARPLKRSQFVVLMHPQAWRTLRSQSKRVDESSVELDDLNLSNIKKSFCGFEVVEDDELPTMSLPKLAPK